MTKKNLSCLLLQITAKHTCWIISRSEVQPLVFKLFIFSTKWLLIWDENHPPKRCPFYPIFSDGDHVWKKNENFIKVNLDKWNSVLTNRSIFFWKMSECSLLRVRKWLANYKFSPNNAILQTKSLDTWNAVFATLPRAFYWDYAEERDFFEKSCLYSKVDLVEVLLKFACQMISMLESVFSTLILKFCKNSENF